MRPFSDPHAAIDWVSDEIIQRFRREPILACMPNNLAGFGVSLYAAPRLKAHRIDPVAYLKVSQLPFAAQLKDGL